MKHIISIGINKTEGLTPLGAAVSGAADFDKWGQSQGYTTTLLIDDTESITQSQIFDEINKITAARNCEMLIVFFSGHGILKSPSQEVWLLSNAKNNPNESINLTASIDNARTSGIPYVVFISDACRVLPNELQFTGNGSVIFPIYNDTNQDCAIDVLYASRPGSPALEQNSTDNAAKFGLFTQTIVEVLNGNYPELIKAKNTGDSLVDYYNIDSLNSDSNYKNLSNGAWQIDIINSEASIKSIVSQKARAISISKKQSPDIRIQYQNPKPFLSEFNDITAKGLLLSRNPAQKVDASPDKPLVRGIQEHLKRGMSPSESINESFSPSPIDIDAIPNSLNVSDLESNLIKNLEFIVDSKGRSSFETQTGFTIIGAQIKEAVAIGHTDTFSENDQVHIRVHPDGDSRSILIVLDNDESIPVAILEGYIGTLVFDNNRLLTINYTPSRNSSNFEHFDQNEKKKDYMRAFVATAANEGLDYSDKFKDEFDVTTTVKVSNTRGYSGQEEAIDPSLGLYAAYAFRQEGKFKDVKSVYENMKSKSGTLIFDVAMLSGKLEDEKDRLGPFCPMIALGWAYRQSFEKYLDPLILEASNHLVPSLWTTFDRKGTAILKELITKNQIK